MCEALQDCPECGDRLIHQSQRGRNESSSAYGQHIHDDYPNTFWWADIDGALYKKATRILRIFEQKFPGQDIKDSQIALFKLLRLAIDYLIADGHVNPGSGAYYIWTTSPWSAAIVDNGHHEVPLSGEALIRLETGLPVPELPDD